MSAQPWTDEKIIEVAAARGWGSEKIATTMLGGMRDRKDPRWKSANNHVRALIKAAKQDGRYSPVEARQNHKQSRIRKWEPSTLVEDLRRDLLSLEDEIDQIKDAGSWQALVAARRLKHQTREKYDAAVAAANQIDPGDIDGLRDHLSALPAQWLIEALEKKGIQVKR